eukprot:TRINITY_DN26194_c0_g1_i2.p1 TRINITY_DN26194_c0_g1~~TRINITY_DN26194_c0_g1_i2.p1  ORF type:complete len:220 (-),score=28.90 TRINITY_DN26194_c0_g1_i2:373-957(-)
MEVLDNLIADEEVNKPLLDVEKWTKLSWSVRRRKALSIIAADVDDEAMAPSETGTAARPGRAKPPLPELAHRYPETALLSMPPTRPVCATPVSSRARSSSNSQTNGAMTSSAPARSTASSRSTRSTAGSSSTATRTLGCCPVLEEAPADEFCVRSARRRTTVERMEADAFLEGLDDPFQNRMELGSTRETYVFG